MSTSVQLETLWVLLNLAYCCDTDIEMDIFVDSFLAHDLLKELWLSSLDYCQESSGLEINCRVVKYQLFDLAMTLFGNMIGHKTAKA